MHGMPGTLKIKAEHQLFAQRRSSALPEKGDGARALIAGMSLPSFPANTLRMRGLSWLPIRFISA